MKITKIATITLSVILVIAMFTFFTSAADISTCTTLDTVSTIYNLQNDLYTNDTCLSVEAANITVDGKGYKIIGNGTGFGINATQNIGHGISNLTVKNINITSFSTEIAIFGYSSPIIAYNGGNLTIINSTMNFVDARGGDGSSGFGGRGGSITIINSTVTQINASGGYGGAAPGGTGGNIYLKYSNFTEIDVTGGSSHIISSGGTGGSITIIDTIINLTDNILLVNPGPVGLGGTGSVGHLIFNYSSSISDENTNYGTNASLTLINRIFGEIVWLSSLVTSSLGGKLQTNTTITNNSVFVDSLSSPELNKSANITLYGIGDRGLINPTILKDGSIVCNATTSPSCHNFTALDATTVTFNVSSWSTYSISGSPNVSLVTECTNLTVPNKVYHLQNEIQSVGTCIRILNNSITLLGQGNKINYSTSQTGYGIYTGEGLSGITISNITIAQVGSSTDAYGIYINATNNTALSSITINTTGTESDGIFFQDSIISQVLDVSIYTNGSNSNGIFFSNETRDVNIQRGKIESYASSPGIGDGIETRLATNVTVRDISKILGYRYGIWFDETNDSKAYNNTIEDINIAIIAWDLSNNINITLNTVISSATALYISGDNNYLNRNTVHNYTNRGIIILDADYNVIESNIINTSNPTSNEAIYIQGDSKYNNLTNATLSGSKKSAIHLTQFQGLTPIDNTFTNITITGVPSTFFDLEIVTNGINNTHVIDSYFATYYINDSSLKITNSTYGEINFLERITINDSNKFTINNNSIDVNVTSNSGLNKSANITLYGIGDRGLINPTILKDGSIVCNATTSPSCHNFTALDATTVTFNVSSWSNYSIGETPDTSPPSVTSLTESPADPATYVNNAEYQFNATITDASSLDTIYLEFNGTNYTAFNMTANVYNVTIKNLAVGTYSYYWWANDTEGNTNNSESGTYTINKAIPVINLSINNTENNITLESSQTILLNGTLITGDSGATLRLYNDGAIINEDSTEVSNNTEFSAEGFYNITLIYLATQNYSQISKTFWVDVFNTGNLTSCGNLTIPHIVYTIQNDLQSNGTCIVVQNESIIFNGLGRTINYSATVGGHGIEIEEGWNQTKIRNIRLTQISASSSSHGITGKTANYTEIDNVNITTKGSTSYGVYFQSGSDYLSINDSHFSCSGDNSYCLYLIGSDYSNLFNTTSITSGLSAFATYLLDTNYSIVNKVTSSSSDIFAIRLQKSHNNIIKNSNFSSTATFSASISISDGRNNTFVNSSLYTPNSDAITISVATSDNNIFQNLTIFPINRSHNFINFGTAGIDGTTLINMPNIQNYTFTGNGGTINIEDTILGKVEFISAVNGSGGNLSEIIKIKNNSVIFNSNYTDFNKPANITFYSLGNRGFTIPGILYNGNSDCDSTTSPSCHNFTALDATTVTFNVSSWSNYSIGERISTPVVGGGEEIVGGGGFILYPNQSFDVNFTFEKVPKQDVPVPAVITGIDNFITWLANKISPKNFRLGVTVSWLLVLLLVALLFSDQLNNVKNKVRRVRVRRELT